MSLGIRHLHRRRKAQGNPAAPPERLSPLQITLDILIYPAAFIAPLALVPQVIQVYSTQDVSGLSLPTWYMLGFFNVLWIIYACVHRERPVLVANILFFTFHVAVVAGILLYR